MPDRRELSRRKARERRLTARNEALVRARTNAELASNALQQAICILAEPELKQYLLARHIQSVPTCLSPGGHGNIGKRQQDFTQGTLENISLDFAVTWKFLYPLLAHSEIRAYLDRSRPSFIPELKDAFIALVVDGPFPNAMSGHRGRKHQSDYYAQT